MRAIGLFLGLTACSTLPVSALIRSPVDSKCQAYGLKGCPELVDGAIAYAEGNKPAAIAKIETARSLNTPAQLQAFAAELRSIGETTPEAKPLIEVADLLVGTSVDTKTTAAVTTPVEPKAIREVKEPSTQPVASSETGATLEEARRLSPEQLALYALAARSDPMRLLTETVPTENAAGAACQIAGSEGLCIRGRQGPVVVTDVLVSEECGARVYLLAADSDTPAFGFLWTLPARAEGIHGGNFSVAGGQWLFIGVKPAPKSKSGDRGCFLTWSGFKPRLIPSTGKDFAF